MEHTPRYQLTYPTSSDEVDDAPQQFKTMCESVETALAMVDDRQTSEAVKPVVRTTLAQLTEAAGVTGQTGYVTGDGSNNGAYVWSGSAWVKLAYAEQLAEVGPVTLIESQHGKVTGVKVGRVAQIYVDWKSASGDSWGSGSFGTMPEGWRPITETHGSWPGRDSSSQREFVLKTDGTFTYNNRGGSQNTGGFNTTMVYLVAE